MSHIVRVHNLKFRSDESLVKTSLCSNFNGSFKSLSSLLSHCWCRMRSPTILDIPGKPIQESWIHPSRYPGWSHRILDRFIQESWLTPSRNPGWLHPGHPVLMNVLIISWLIVVSFREQIWRWECEEPVYWPNHFLFRPTDPVIRPSRSQCPRIPHGWCVWSLWVDRSVTGLSAASCLREGVAPEHRNRTAEPKTLRPFYCSFVQLYRKLPQLWSCTSSSF